MEIVNVTTTKNAVSTTEIAKHNLEYSISNKQLIRVTDNMYGIKTAPEAEDVYLGQIVYDNEMISASFTGSSTASSLMADFESIMINIKKDVAGK